MDFYFNERCYEKARKFFYENICNLFLIKTIKKMTEKVKIKPQLCYIMKHGY
jgi:hypothetical protein